MQDMRLGHILFILLPLLLMGSCQQAGTPRPYGYVRITVPEASYAPIADDYPFTFEQSTSSEIKLSPQTEGLWLTLHYPTINADIHCTYYPIENNLRELIDDAMEFVHKHISQATAIPTRDYVNEESQVYGVLFTIEGNAASPCQFFVTDSTTHFLRGAVYCNCHPNADSLKPVLDFMKDDVIHLMETLTWK